MPKEGYKHTKEHRKKLSVAKKGHVGYWLGKKHSEETKRKISLTQKRKKHGVGKKISKKNRRKISEAQKGNQHWLGKKHSEKSKKKMSRVWKSRIITKEIRKKMSEAQKGKILSEEHKKKIGEGNKGKKISEETKKKISVSAQEIDIKDWNGFVSREPYDQNWTLAFKRTIRKRDNQICLVCKIHREKLKKALDVHHIDSNKKNTCMKNCVSLCHSCHGKTKINKKEWQTFFRLMLNRLYGYEYGKK